MKRNEKKSQAQTYVQYQRELLEPDLGIGESANQAFSSRNTGALRRLARMDHDQRSWCDCFPICFTFFLQNESVSETKVKVFFETKMKLFLKRECLFGNHLRSESVFEMKVKLFLKRKDFNCKRFVFQSKMLTIRQMFVNILKAISFWLHLKKTKR